MCPLVTASKCQEHEYGSLQWAVRTKWNINTCSLTHNTLHDRSLPCAQVCLHRLSVSRNPHIVLLNGGGGRPGLLLALSSSSSSASFSLRRPLWLQPQRSSQPPPRARSHSTCRSCALGLPHSSAGSRPWQRPSVARSERLVQVICLLHRQHYARKSSNFAAPRLWRGVEVDTHTNTAAAPNHAHLGGGCAKPKVRCKHTCA